MRGATALLPCRCTYPHARQAYYKPTHGHSRSPVAAYLNVLLLDWQPTCGVNIFTYNDHHNWVPHDLDRGKSRLFTRLSAYIPSQGLLTNGTCFSRPCFFPPRKARTQPDPYCRTASIVHSEARSRSRPSPTFPCNHFHLSQSFYPHWAVSSNLSAKMNRSRTAIRWYSWLQIPGG